MDLLHVLTRGKAQSCSAVPLGSMEKLAMDIEPETSASPYLVHERVPGERKAYGFCTQDNAGTGR